MPQRAFQVLASRSTYGGIHEGSQNSKVHIAGKNLKEILSCAVENVFESPFRRFIEKLGIGEAYRFNHLRKELNAIKSVSEFFWN